MITAPTVIADSSEVVTMCQTMALVISPINPHVPAFSDGPIAIFIFTDRETEVNGLGTQ